MLKTLIGIVIAVACVSTAFCAPFSPDVLKISAPSTIKYDFDGKALSIPVTLTGTQANVIFSIFTKNKAETIGKTTNGYLGWHYVNKIDTCMYVSGVKALDKGSNTILWDGKGDGNALIPAGEYTYYLWGYDAVKDKAMVAWKVTWNHSTHQEIVTHDGKGKPRTQPIFYLNTGYSKWVIGSDPMDSTLVETTTSVPNRQFKFDPADTTQQNYFIHVLTKDKGDVRKYKRVPNGVSVLQTDWGNNNGITNFHQGVNFTAGGGMSVMGDIIYVGLYDRDNGPNTVLCYLERDTGDLLRMVDLSDRWFRTADKTAGAQAGGGPGQVFDRNGMLFLATFNACYREMIDPSIESEKEFVKWGNGNGDYVGDHNFEPTAAKPWVCFDYNVSPYAYTTDADDNLFSTFGAYDMGAVSFGLVAPDGTGIGYLAFSGETAKYKQGPIFCDYGSAYDGIYTDKASVTLPLTVGGKGTWFIGHDSIKGTIGQQIGVKEDAPAAFTVAQNSPNPFNPSTTITFTTAKAGKVTVEVFNSSGQKVDTIVDGNMNAGSHSVVWNASKLSAGVYFYTVKAGDFTKTKRMTFLK